MSGFVLILSFENMIDYVFIDFLPSPIVSSHVSALIKDQDIHTFLCVSICYQSKSVSSTDSQPTEERQGPSGGYSALQGGAEAKRRRCDDKEPLPPHSYVGVFRCSVLMLKLCSYVPCILMKLIMEKKVTFGEPQIA